MIDLSYIERVIVNVLLFVVVVFVKFPRVCQCVLSAYINITDRVHTKADCVSNIYTRRAAGRAGRRRSLCSRSPLSAQYVARRLSVGALRDVSASDEVPIE